MAGTKAGAAKARATNLARNPQHYRDMGKLGGVKCNPKKGFGTHRTLARLAGELGGSISRRSKAHD